MTDKNATEYNKRQWNALADAGVVCSRPIFNMTADRAHEIVDDEGLLGDLAGRRVLCLANGGGQQSVAFAFLGAEVTVFDHSVKQLAGDRLAADHYGFTIRTVEGDIRDLTDFEDGGFDIVSQGYSINYVPKIDAVFDGVARVLRPGGKYVLACHNPFVHGSWVDGCWGSSWRKEDLWKDIGYPIRLPYVEGSEITTWDPYWNFHDADGNEKRLPAPQEYRHLLSTIVNGLIDRGLMLLRIQEDGESERDPEAEPGSWEHYQYFAPPWMTVWSEKRRCED